MPAQKSDTQSLLAGLCTPVHERLNVAVPTPSGSSAVSTSAAGDDVGVIVCVDVGDCVRVAEGVPVVVPVVEGEGVPVSELDGVPVLDVEGDAVVDGDGVTVGEVDTGAPLDRDAEGDAVTDAVAVVVAVALTDAVIDAVAEDVSVFEAVLVPLAVWLPVREAVGVGVDH